MHSKAFIILASRKGSTLERLFFVGSFNYILVFQAAGFTMMTGTISLVIFKPYNNSLYDMQDSVTLLSGALLELHWSRAPRQGHYNHCDEVPQNHVFQIWHSWCGGIRQRPPILIRRIRWVCLEVEFWTHHIITSLPTI